MYSVLLSCPYTPTIIIIHSHTGLHMKQSVSTQASAWQPPACMWPKPQLEEKYSPTYRMAGNFRGSQFSRFSRLTGDPRKLNKKPKRTFLRRRHAHARAITGGVAIVVHAAAGSI